MNRTAGPVRLLDLGGLPGLHTQAVYHVLAERMTEARLDAVVLTWPTEPYLCLGYHQNAASALDFDAARARGLPVVRRRVGGGLTHLDANQVFYQFVFHHRRVPAVPRELYARLLRVPLGALARLGIEAQLVRTNELEIGARRIAGIGAGRLGEASVLVGNVLLDFDWDAMTSVWPRPTRGFHELARNALSERITTLAREGIAVTRADVLAALAEQVSVQLGCKVVPSGLTDEEVAALEPMARALSRPDFVHRDDAEPVAGRRLSLKISARASVCAQTLGDGELRVAVLVQDDVIVEARAESSSLGGTDALEASLAGRPLAELDARLAGFRNAARLARARVE